MSKYTVNMSDQLMKVRVNTQEKLKKEAEVVVEIEQPSALQSATADYLSRKEEPHPLGSPTNLNEMKKVEIKLNRGNVDKDIQKIVKHIGLVNKKRRPNQQIKITQNMSDDSVTLDGGKNVDIDREVADIRNFIGYKSAKVVESVEEETLDEGKMDGAAKDLEKEAKQNKGSMDEKSYKVMAKLMKQGNPKQILSYYKGLDTEPRERIAMVLKKNIGEKQAGKILSVSFSNNREEVDLDEKIKIEFKTDPKNPNKTMIMKKGKHQGDIIKTNKGYQVMQFNKPAGKIFKSLDDIKPAVRKLYGEEVDLDEREKSVRQLINPTKEVMVVKKNKVVVIDKKDQDKYMKQGWSLAEQIEQSNDTKGE